jgi:diguanylate cyclase (GGDEF)-like protein/PAS domain S-box-containing protein
MNRVGTAEVESDNTAETIIASLQEGVMVVDRDGRVTKANEAAARLWGIALGELVGSRFADLAIEVHQPDGSRAPEADAPVLRALRGETVHGAVVQVVRRDGRTLWAEVNASPLAEPGGRDYGALSTYVDVTERVQLERRTRHEADSDPLTGLANRRALERTLDAGIERARRDDREVAVLMLDLDGFKGLNDRWGHLAGDRALRAVADRLQRCVRERDLVARNGGDEFVIVLPDLHPGAPAASECRERVEVALSAPVRFEAGSTTLTAACGVATFPSDGADGVTLLALADRAMYADKR